MAAQIGQVSNAVTRDKDWIRRTFMLAENHTDASAQQWRLETLASQKFTDTRPGGNWTINNVPQFTRHADVRNAGLNTANQAPKSISNTNGRVGMGRYYSEAIDDNSQILHLRFGVPEYNGMLSFFTSFYDGDAGTLANEGRGSIAYYVGRAIGMVVSLGVYLAFPLLAVASMAIRFFWDKPASSYYYMRPTMPLYWNRVNFIANTLATNLGVVPRKFYSDNGATVGKTEAKRASGVEETGEGEGVAAYNAYAFKHAGDIFREGGGIDVYKVANRAQRMANHRREAIIKSLETAPDDGYAARLENLRRQQKWDHPEGEGIEKYLDRYHASAMGDKAHIRAVASAAAAKTDVSQLNAEQPPAPATAEQTAAPGTAPAPAAPVDGEAAAAEELKKNDYVKSLRAKWKAGASAEEKEVQGGYDDDGGDETQDGFWKFWIANRSEGSDFISWRIDNPGTVSESFSNSTRDSDIASKINGMSNSARSARFSFSDGNTGIGGLDAIKSMVGGVISGALDSVHMSGLLSLAGSAMVNIPKHWESSSATFPSSSYTIQLRSPYGNLLSRYLNLYIPLACLLAGALPLATGKQSHTAPFLCQLYYRGRNQIKLGMISSLSITRGEGNLGWTKNNECLGIDVTFEVTDLSTTMAAPIDSGFSLLKPWKALFDEDTAFYDYMAMLGNLSLADQLYKMRRLSLRLTQLGQQFDTYWSMGHLASAMDSNWITRQGGNVYGLFVRASERAVGN